MLHNIFMIMMLSITIIDRRYVVDEADVLFC